MGASPLPGADRHSSLSECGRRSIRPQLKKMVSALQRGDLVLVTRLDRLGRSVRELLNLLAEFDKMGPVFAHLAIRGVTPPRRTGGSCSQCSAAWLSLSVS
jgi:hypothetical protein